MNAIIGCAFNYQWDQLWPFVVSARKHAPDSRVVLLTHGQDAETRAALEENNVWQFPCTPEPPYCPPYVASAGFIDSRHLRPMHIVCSRFLMALAFLRRHGDEFQGVLLADVRDTLIGGDPFAFPWDQERACVVREDERMTLGSCPYNRAAMERLAGREVTAILSSQSVVCSGAIIGNVGQVSRLLELMLDLFAKSPAASLMDDQAVVNWLVAHEPNAIRVYPSDATPIYHAGYVPRERVKWGGVAFVHQYDRFVDLAPSLIESLTT